MKTDTNATDRILIVDDEAANLRLLNRLLRSQGYENIVLVQDPRKALGEYLEQRPDLILLDINMPCIDGYELLAQFNALDDPLLPPVVMLTAQARRESLLEALAAGARDYILKPFDRSELLMRVRNLLEAQRAHYLLHSHSEQLDDLVRERTEELRNTRLQVVQRLGKAAEYRDEETGEHILRMSHTSALLADAVGWSSDRTELMLHASPMHDIGKIGIPDSILLKPGKLSPPEWAVMQTHTLIGGKLLDGDDSELMIMARDIALAHHERWDGSGYPSALAGEDIPEAGRIVAVADVFDALTSERPYKMAWSVEDATAYIRDQRGRQFEPALVDVFMAKLPEILDIRERFSEHDRVEPA